MRSRRFADKLRVDPETGKKNFAFIQAEDELAAIGMVLGANWNGARAFTATSGPGVSLMNEFLGLAYYAEVPAVLFDIQRVGPSTGMPTRTQQCDILEAAYASHGDTKHVCLFPRDPEECFYFARDAFDLAERLQTPVHGDVGSRHRHERLDVPRISSGTTTTCRIAARCWIEGRDREAREIPSLSRRTTATAFRIARCRACIPRARISRAARATPSTAGTPRIRAEYQIVLDRLARKFTTAKRWCRKAVIEQDAQASTSPWSPMAAPTARCAKRSTSWRARASRLTTCGCAAFPFGEEVEKFLEQQKLMFVVEQNRDAQMRSLLTLETRVEKAKLRSLLHYSGLPISSEFIVKGCSPRSNRRPASPKPSPATSGVA